MPRVTYVKAAAKDHGDIKKGEPYYWWKFRYGPKLCSKTRPKQSQLTQSGYLQAIYSLQEIEQPDFDMLSDALDNMKSELEQLRDEQQEKLDNMPDNLRENSSSGQLLQERYDALDNAINDLDSVDVPDEDTLVDEVRDAYTPAEGEPEWDKLSEERSKELIDEAKSEKVDELWNEITSALDSANV